MKNSTPTPWTADGYDGKASIIIHSQWGEVARIVDNGDTNQRDANAALIVRAVNSHQALVDALHNGLRAMKALGWEQATPSLNRTAYEQARQALALATK